MKVWLSVSSQPSGSLICSFADHGYQRNNWKLGSDESFDHWHLWLICRNSSQTLHSFNVRALERKKVDPTLIAVEARLFPGSFSCRKLSSWSTNTIVPGRDSTKLLHDVTETDPTGSLSCHLVILHGDFIVLRLSDRRRTEVLCFITFEGYFVAI